MATRQRDAGRGVVAALALGLLMSIGTHTAWAAGASDPNACPAPKVPVASSTLTCPDDESPSPAPSTSAPSTPPTTGSESQKSESKSSEGVKFGEEDEPTGWAGPIAKDLGQSAQDLSADLAKRLKDDGLLPKFEFTRAYLSLYALMFGLGVVIAAMATMVASVKIAAAKGVDSRILAQQALIRLLAFSAVGALAPLMLAVVGNLTQALAGGFFDLAADQLASQLNWVAGALGVGTLAGLIVPGGSAVMVGLFLALLVAFAGIFLELMMSHYLVFLLGLLIPILFAASINPEWQGGVKKVIGALLGAFLAPAALFIIWVLVFAAVPPPSPDNSFITRAGVLIVGLLFGLAAPVAIGVLMSYVIPAFAGGNGYQTGLLNGSLSGVSRRSGSQPTGPRTSRAKRAADTGDTTPIPTVESPTAPGGGGAASSSTTAGSGGGAAAGTAGASTSAASAAGPVGAAVGMWTRMVDKARRFAEGTRDTVASSASRAEASDRGDATPDHQRTTAGNAPDGRRSPDRSDPPAAPNTPTNASAEAGGTDRPQTVSPSRRAETDTTEVRR